MTRARKVRFSVSLDADLNRRIEALAERQRPKVTKRYLVELAVERFVNSLNEDELYLGPNTERGGREQKNKA